MEITKLSDFTTVLTKIKSDENRQLFYRGHSNREYQLLPNLYRKEMYYLSEDKIFKETIVNCPHEFYSCKSTLEILVKMQHYDIPTRILDLTRNPLVALYFACSSRQDIDGEILLLHIPNKDVCFYDSDRVTILSNLTKQNLDFKFDFKADFDYENEDDVKEVNDKYFGYLLHSIKEDKPHFYNIINPKDVESVFAVQVKLDNPRIIRQNGAFLIYGVEKDKSTCSKVNPDWILKPDNEQIIIPSKFKGDIQNELNSLGINVSTIFPELDDYADYIKKKYDKKNIR